MVLLCHVLLHRRKHLHGPRAEGTTIIRDPVPVPIALRVSSTSRGLRDGGSAVRRVRDSRLPRLGRGGTKQFLVLLHPSFLAQQGRGPRLVLSPDPAPCPRSGQRVNAQHFRHAWRSLHQQLPCAVPPPPPPPPQHGGAARWAARRGPRPRLPSPNREQTRSVSAHRGAFSGVGPHPPLLILPRNPRPINSGIVRSRGRCRERGHGRRHGARKPPRLFARHRRAPASPAQCGGQGTGTLPAPSSGGV